MSGTPVRLIAAGIALSLLPVLAFAAPVVVIEPKPRLYDDLPMRSTAPILGVIPNVGATPGIVIEYDSPTTKCSRDAQAAADGLMAPMTAVGTCNEAILAPSSAAHEVAGSHVNRGVLLLTMLQIDDAKRDFERALEIDQDQAEALVNRGAMAIAEGRAAAGVADLDRAIALGPERPERAYYHRGLGREDLNDIRGAYADYRMALTLNPEMTEAATELSRFQVRARN